MQLKKYKSCAGCIWYEEARRPTDQRCSFGFVTEKTEEIKMWSTHLAGTHTAFVQIRPKIGCFKPYNAARLRKVIVYIEQVLGGWAEFQKKVIIPQIAEAKFL